MSGNLSWDDFKSQIKEIIKFSETINDNWILEEMNDDPGGSLLKYIKIQSIEEQIFKFEYHILYSLSYSVPVIYFNVVKIDTGQLLSLEEFKEIFVNKNDLDATKMDLYSVLTQMEHPLKFRPFLVLHPCKTEEVLRNFLDSRNKVLTFISLYGPFIFLNLELDYGKELNFK
uniref:Ubiquitin-like-conjugating enzyme ATG10 n=1 Tax=Culicoides sonorensis TaxID=179676 RepID=A0A336KKK8_CULSO